jgi:hypothetical protein
MYDYWFPAEKQNGRNMVLLGLEKFQIDSDDLPNHFRHLGPIQTRTISRGGRIVGPIYYRIGYHYRASKDSAEQIR